MNRLPGFRRGNGSTSHLTAGRTLQRRLNGYRLRMDDERPPSESGRAPTSAVPRLLQVMAAYSWRLVVVGAVLVGALVLIGKLLAVIVPIGVALLLARALHPVAAQLRRARVPNGAAAGLALGGALAVLAAVLAAVVMLVVGELDDIGRTASEGLDELQRRVVSIESLQVTESEAERWRAQLAASSSSFARSHGGLVVSGTQAVATTLVGVLLTLFLAFFMLKDGPRLMDVALSRAAADRGDLWRRCSMRAWDAVGGYLRGAALLGVVESVAIGSTLAALGGSLVAPIMVITFLAAFVPIIGAIGAGVLAVLVALVSAGPGGALVMAVVAFAVQQVDNDLLAPVIYGRSLRLHPAAVLLSIATATALFGLVGTVSAVPVLGVVMAVMSEYRANGRSDGDAPQGMMTARPVILPARSSNADVPADGCR